MKTEKEVTDFKISLQIERSTNPYSDKGLDLATEIKVLQWVLGELDKEIENDNQTPRL